MAGSQSQSDKDKARDAHILMSRYERLYREKYDRRPRINRYSAKWGMMDVIDSVGNIRTGELLDYFFKTPSEHTLEVFYRNFDKMDTQLDLICADRAYRAMLARQTEERVKEARDQHRE